MKKQTFPPLLFLLSALVVVAFAGPSPVHAKASPTDRDELFDGPIQAFDIRIRPADMRILRQQMGWGGGKRAEVPATVKVGTNIYEKVAIHLKGSAGSFRPVDANPALTLNFGKLNPDQTCLGHKKLHLNNSVQDPSLMEELLASTMYLKVGVPTTRATHAFVTLNGRYLGVYVMKEGWDKGFLKKNFGSSKGNLYDGGFVRDIDNELERDSGDGPDDKADLGQLVSALRIGDPDKCQTAVAKILDWDKFLTYTAMQVVLDDWDGYARNRNNYRIYHDPTTDRLVFMAHGMDQLFQQPASTFHPNFNGLAARRVFMLPGMRAALGERMMQLTNTVYNHAFMFATLDAAEKRLIEGMTAHGDDRSDINSEKEMVADLKGRVQIRLDRFASFSVIPSKLAKFDKSGVCRPTAWQPLKDVREGPGGEMELRTNSAQGQVFVVKATQTGSVGSWRTSLLLGPGRYRFEAKAMTKGVVGGETVQKNVGIGAGIRISRGTRRNSLLGDTDWQAINYVFTVDPGNVDQQVGGREVMLVAELRADAGEAMFDADSLVVRKLEE